jgi:hypothetical protein
VPPEKGSRPRKKQWYSVTVETLRGLAVLLLVLVAGTGAVFGYRAWQRQAYEREAARQIENAGELLQRVRDDRRAADHGQEIDTAFQSLEQARVEFDRRDFAAARASARRATSVLQSILEALSLPGSPGEAQFISVQGMVEVRRGETGGWEEAHNRMPLRQGDFVRTAGGGSAEIVFRDGTLYTVRPNTQFVVSPAPTAGGRAGEQAIQMEYGWVNLATRTSASKVSTPGAEARVEQESEGFVAYEAQSRRGRFGAFRGGMELSGAGGERRAVGELQQVVQTGDRLSEPRPLPGRPEPLAPADDVELALGEVPRLALSWKPAPGAARYALQVSRNRLFTDNVIDVAGRARTSATLGVRGAGSFQWRVAAVGADGSQGPWSEPRAFRVTSFEGGQREDGGDTTPPQLELERVQPYGNIFMVGGRSEPGSQVLINDELVKVEADGSFTKTVQLTKEGWTHIKVLARDGSGNESVIRRSVFVENP